MTVSGSGKFVSIAASNTQIDQMFSSAMSGITFGIGSAKYCQISSKYEAEQGIVTGTALCMGKRSNRKDGKNNKGIPVQIWTAYKLRRVYERGEIWYT